MVHDPVTVPMPGVPVRDHTCPSMPSASTPFSPPSTPCIGPLLLLNLEACPLPHQQALDLIAAALATTHAAVRRQAAVTMLIGEGPFDPIFFDRCRIFPC